MKKLIILLLIILCSQVDCLAQGKFRPGKVIFKNQDTTRAYINMLSWNSTPEVINYKTEVSSDEVTEVSANDILGFIVDGKADFISATVRFDRSSDLLRQLSFESEPIWETRTIFLQKLVESEVSLYWYNGKNNERFFYRKGDGALEPLIYKRYFTSASKRATQTNENFKNQLWQHFKCGTTQQEIRSVAYDAKSLTKFFEEFNACEGNPSQSNEADQDPLPLTFKVIVRGGIGIAQGDFGDANLERFAEFESANVTYLEAELEYRLTRKNPFTLSLGLGYFGYNSMGTWEDLNFLNTTGTAAVLRDRTWTVNASYLNLSFNLKKYFMWKEDQGFYLNSSFLPVLSMALNSEIAVAPAEDVRSPDARNTPIVVEPKERWHFGLGGGLLYQGFILDVRYFTERDRLSDNRNFTSSFSSLNLSVGYCF